MSSHLHVPPVSDGAHAEQEEGGDHHLVQDAAGQGQVRRGEGAEDARSVRRGPVAAPVVLIPNQRVPVDNKHRGGGQERAEILASEIVRHLSGQGCDIRDYNTERNFTFLVKRCFKRILKLPTLSFRFHYRKQNTQVLSLDLPFK